MPSALTRNFAARSGRPESEVERMWERTATLVTDQYGIREPKDDAQDEVKEAYYGLRLRALCTMLNLNESEALDEVGMSDVVSFLLGASSGGALKCSAKLCANHGGKKLCALKVSEVSINRNWECNNYERKQRVKGTAARATAR